MKNLIIEQWEGNTFKNANNVYSFGNPWGGSTYITKKGDDEYHRCNENGSGRELGHGTCTWEEAKWMDR